MAQVYSFKITGRTAASTDGSATGLIATVAVSYDSDGYLRFTDANGRPRAVSISNSTSDVAALLRLIFTGSGGVDAGTTNVQGHRVFGEPALKQ